MKKLLMVIALAIAGSLFAQDKAMSLADAKGKIGDVIADPASMTAVMKQLSAEDQTAFLAEVNAAIAKMPGSADELAAKFLAVDSAALQGAKDGNLTALVAEVYATVPPNALTVINESFAANQFNRSADPSKTYTDEQFTKMSKDLVNKVQERTATADNAGVRNTFAILMMIRASNGSPNDLRDTLVDSLNDPATKELAQTEWISPALGIGQEKTYDPMLGAADAGEQPNIDESLAVSVSYPDAMAALTGDLASECSIADPSSSFIANLSPSFDNPIAGGAGGPASLADGAGSQGLSTLPRTMDSSAAYNPGYKRGQKISTSESEEYAGQTTY